MKEIKLTNGMITLIDEEDYEWLMKYNWYYNPEGYAITRTSSYSLEFMHRMIMNPPKGLFVDHINHNKLDNRRKNLRICTHAQNKQNQPKRADNTSGYKGVYISDKYTNRYRAKIRVNGVLENLGTFANIEDAARAYNQAAKFYFGEFACLNDVPEKPLPSWITTS